MAHSKRRDGCAGDAVYFTFVTGLTIGYGDIVPRQALARALAIGIGVSGRFLTGLIAGIAVYAMRTALTHREPRRREPQARRAARGSAARSRPLFRTPAVIRRRRLRRRKGG